MADGRPHIEVTGQDKFLLKKDYNFVWQAKGNLWNIKVKAPFHFDGASIPSFARFFIGKWELGLVPPLVHDWLYYHSGNLPHSCFQYYSHGQWINDNRTWSRYNADRLFCRISRIKGINKIRRRVAYLGIRAFGWYSWGSKK